MTRPPFLVRFAAALLFLTAGLATSVTAQTTESVFRTYKKAAAFDDVKFELNNAIIEKGLALDHTGAIGKMLDRTGADVGSDKPVYKDAEYLSFCSAKFSRRMMEADPANIAFCPFIVFIYEDAKQPGTTVVGYRRPAIIGNEASQKALTEIDALLDSIAREATR